MVYGEKDKFISKKLRNKVINAVKEKDQPTVVLKGQDHDPWDFDVIQKIYKEELRMLKASFS